MNGKQAHLKRMVSLFLLLILTLSCLSETAIALINFPIKTQSVRGNSTGNIVNIGFGYAYSSEDDFVDGLNHQFINLYKGYLYYVDQASGGRLYRENRSTGATERLSSSKDTAYVNVVDDTIFFVDVPAGYVITRMDLDGSNRKKLSKLRASRLCAYDGMLYFANWDGNNTGLWSMDYNGDCRTHIVYDDIPLFINVNSDGIFWISNDDKCICKTTFSGQTTYYEKIKNVSALNMYGGYAYFVWDGFCGYGIYRSSDFKNATLVYAADSSEKTIDCLSVCDGRIFYRSGGGKKSNKTDGKLKSFTFSNH